MVAVLEICAIPPFRDEGIVCPSQEGVMAMTFTTDWNFIPPDPAEVCAAWQLDPLEEERGGYLVIDRVDIVRIACVAVETGARFQRDGLAQDPMDWMLSSSSLFGGHPPIAACRRKDACSLAILVHGLGLPSDIAPDSLDSILIENGLKDVEAYEEWAE